MFTRSLPTDLVNALTVSPFWASILADPDLCPQVREDRLTVYHRGCGLIREVRLKKGRIVAKVNRKFVPFRSGAGDLELAGDSSGGLQFTTPPVALPLGHADRPTLDAYKTCVGAQARPEMDLVHNIIRHENGRNVILDQEVEFAEPGEKPDRIDLCWFDTGGKTLVFVEVKRVEDRRLFAIAGNGPPKVLAQLRRYQDRLSRHRGEVLEAYRRVVDLKRQLGLGGGLLGVPDEGALDLLEKPLLVIGGCTGDGTRNDRSRIMAGEGEWAPLMGGLREVAAGVILCGESCRLVLQTRTPTSLCYLPGR